MNLKRIKDNNDKKYSKEYDSLLKEEKQTLLQILSSETNVNNFSKSDPKESIVEAIMEARHPKEAWDYIGKVNDSIIPPIGEDIYEEDYEGVKLPESMDEVYAEIKDFMDKRVAFTIMMGDDTDTYIFVPTDKGNWYGGIVQEHYFLFEYDDEKILEELHREFEERELTHEMIEMWGNFIAEPFVPQDKLFDPYQQLIKGLRIPFAEPYYSYIYNWCKKNTWLAPKDFEFDKQRLKDPTFPNAKEDFIFTNPQEPFLK